MMVFMCVATGDWQWWLRSPGAIAGAEFGYAGDPAIGVKDDFLIKTH
jgi:hypothetical protein